MSMVLINPSSPDRVFYTHLFARCIRDRRRELRLSTSQAAELAGVAESQWCALEAGWVPREHRQIRVIAEALELRSSDLSVVSMMSLLAQEQSVQ